MLACCWVFFGVFAIRKKASCGARKHVLRERQNLTMPHVMGASLAHQTDSARRLIITATWWLCISFLLQLLPVHTILRITRQWRRVSRSRVGCGRIGALLPEPNDEAWPIQEESRK